MLTVSNEKRIDAVKVISISLIIILCGVSGFLYYQNMQLISQVQNLQSSNNKFNSKISSENASIVNLQNSLSDLNASLRSLIQRLQAELIALNATLAQIQAAIGIYQLSVNSFPSNRSFTLNGTAETTPYSRYFLNKTYVVAFSGLIIWNNVFYAFAYWDDNHSDMNTTRTINLQSDTTVKAIYQPLYMREQ